MIDYSKLYKTMLYMSCYRFMPEYFKPAFDVKNETYTSIVSYPENAVQHANYDFYSNLLSTGLTMERTNLPQMNFVNMMSRIYPANLLSKVFLQC